MKKFIKSAIISTIASVSLFAGQLSDAETKNIQQLPLFMGSGIMVQKAYKDGDFILLRALIQGNVQEFVLTSDKKHLIAGKVYNTQSGEELSMPNDVSVLKGKEALTYGSGKEIYYLFTDPECPYCKKFESYFEQIEKNVQIKVFFFPLSFHKNAMDMTKYIIDNKSNEDKVHAMLTLDIEDKDFKEKKYTPKREKELQAIIDENMKLADEFGVRGTPALFDKDGKSVSWVGLLQKFGIQVQ